MKNYKVIFCDLDGTLIDTVSGETFPKGIWDMYLNFEVLKALKEAKPELIAIVTNQGGIESGFVNKTHFQAKLEYIQFAIKEYTGVPCVGMMCPTNDKNDPFRKPNTKMLQVVLNSTEFAKEDCCMVGDASGKPGQFSDSDKKTAENFDIDYFDVEDFIEEFNE